MAFVSQIKIDLFGKIDSTDRFVSRADRFADSAVLICIFCISNYDYAFFRLLFCVNVAKYADYAYNITVCYVAIIMLSPVLYVLMVLLFSGFLWFS